MYLPLACWFLAEYFQKLSQWYLVFQKSIFYYFVYFSLSKCGGSLLQYFIVSSFYTPLKFIELPQTVKKLFRICLALFYYCFCEKKSMLLLGKKH